VTSRNWRYSPRPRNGKRASAYAAGRLTASASAVESRLMTVLLRNATPKFAAVHMSTKFCHCQCIGSQRAG